MFSYGFCLVDEKGNVIRWANNPNHLKNVFDTSGLEKAYVRFKPDDETTQLVVTKETTNKEWNEFSQDHYFYPN